MSIPHADRWRGMFAIYVEGLGGNGYSSRLGGEAQRLRGLPPVVETSDGGDTELELEDHSGAEA